jgi:hypothetical protein
VRLLVALGRREKEQKERNKGREGGGGVYVVYAHIMVIYIVYAYINRSYIYYMHDYSNCARLENIFPSM